MWISSSPSGSFLERPLDPLLDRHPAVSMAISSEHPEDLPALPVPVVKAAIGDLLMYIKVLEEYARQQERDLWEILSAWREEFGEPYRFPESVADFSEMSEVLERVAGCPFHEGGPCHRTAV